MKTPLLSTLILGVLSGVCAADDWPQWLGSRRDSVWRESGIVETLPKELNYRWRIPLGGGYAGPSVVGDRVYVTDYKTAGNQTPNPQVRNQLQGQERILCLSATTGEEIWKHEYDCAYAVSYPAGPRCTPTVDGDRLYALGAMGNLVCLKSADGSPVWSKDFRKDYDAKVAQWGFCGHPLVDGDRLFCVVGGEGSVAVAFNKHTGEELWRSLSASEQGYSAPTMITAGGTRQLLIWHADALNSLNPDTGAVYWSIPLKPSYGMAIGVPRVSKDMLFVGAYTNVSAAIRLNPAKPAAEVVWRGNGQKGMAPVNMTPFLDGPYMYGVDHRGHVRCVKIEDGSRLWSDLEPVTGGKAQGSATAFVVRHEDRYFLATETGHLVIAEMDPEGYREVSRAMLIEPTGNGFGRKVVWSHPAFANQCIYARNDKEIVCVSLAAE